MSLQQAKNLSIELMENSAAVFLTTIDNDGFPQTRAMLNLRGKRQFPALVSFFAGHHDDFLLYFSTNTSSTKMTEIERNPRAAAYFCNPGEWRGLMLSGEIKVCEDQGIKRTLWQEGWDLYYPGGTDDPEYTIICLHPTAAKLYNQLEVCRFSFV